MQIIPPGLAAIGALVATPVLAADMSVKVPPMMPAPVYNWTGCYAGANIGGIREHGNTPITLVDPTGIATAAFTTGRIASGFSYDRNGVLGGGQFGCNWQVTNWVVGIETDFDGSGLSGGGTSKYGGARLLPAHFVRHAEAGLDRNGARSSRHGGGKRCVTLRDRRRGLCGRTALVFPERRRSGRPGQHFGIGFDDAVWLDGWRRGRGGLWPMVGQGRGALL
jgi:hypothetical protein